LHPAPEAFLTVGDVECFLELVLDREVGRNDEDSALGNTEWQYCGEPGFATSHRQLNDSLLCSPAEEIISSHISFALRISQIRIVFYVCGRIHEVSLETLARP